MTDTKKKNIWSILLKVAILVAALIGGKVADIATKATPAATEIVSDIQEN